MSCPIVIALGLEIKSKEHYIPDYSSDRTACSAEGLQKGITELWYETESLREQGFGPRCSAAQLQQLQEIVCQHLVSGKGDRSKCSTEGDVCCIK